MVSALVPLGTASLLASVVPVNDAATAPLMAAFHDGLRAGAGFADALLAARGGGSGDVVGDRDRALVRRPRPLTGAGAHTVTQAVVTSAPPDSRHCSRTGPCGTASGDEPAQVVEVEPAERTAGRLEVALAHRHAADLTDQAGRATAAAGDLHVDVQPAAGEREQPAALVGADRLEVRGPRIADQHRQLGVEVAGDQHRAGGLVHLRGDGIGVAGDPAQLGEQVVVGQPAAGCSTRVVHVLHP